MDLQAALGAWREIAGADRVSADEAELDRLARTTLPSAPRPVAVIRPASREQVPGIVRAAGAHGVPLYPISRGNNWGYGDACPPTEGQAILDLSGLDRILHVDAELAYAVVEPGVSQGQLHAHLEAAGLPLMLPSSGSSPVGSVLGNALERGWGHTAHGDHFNHVAGLEAVLADGTVVRTGFGHLGARATHLLRWGVGPAVDGLFSQSNLGVVTQLGIHLIPRPERMTTVVFGSNSDADLEAIVDRLRPLRLSGALPGATHISSDVRAISFRMRYPWGEAGGRTPLPRDVAEQLGASLNIRAWNLMAAVSGSSPAELRARARQVRRALKGLGTARTISPALLDRAERIARPLAGLGYTRALETLGTIALARPGLELLMGRPTDFGMDSTEWRRPEGAPAGSGTPLDRGVGLLWLSPVCPAVGRDVRAVVELLREGMGRHGFDALMTITLLNGRAAGVTTSLSYDRDDPADAERALACKEETLARLIEAGYPPYRVGIGDMAHLDAGDDGYWDLVRRVKDAVDPDGILAPGRYAPWQAAGLEAQS